MQVVQIYDTGIGGGGGGVIPTGIIGYRLYLLIPI